MPLTAEQAEQAEQEVDQTLAVSTVWVTSHILYLLVQNGLWSRRGCSGCRRLGQCSG